VKAEDFLRLTAGFYISQTATNANGSSPPRSTTPANVGNHGRMFAEKRFVPGQTAFLLGTVITSPAATTLRDSERALMLPTLEGVGWVIGGPKGAAAKLGLKRTTLINKMCWMGISRPHPQSRQDMMERALDEVVA
jgi:hypothetical protein